MTQVRPAPLTVGLEAGGDAHMIAQTREGSGAIVEHVKGGYGGTDAIRQLAGLGIAEVVAFRIGDLHLAMRTPSKTRPPPDSV